MSVLSPYLFFLRTSWRNRVLQFTRRIRSPRYAIALIIGFVYFFFAFGGPTLFNGRSTSRSGGTGLIEMAEAVGPLLLIILAAFWWIHGGLKQALAFTPAEANLLVPAPLTRRQLIQFKLLNSLPGTLFTALMFTLILRGAPLPAGVRFVSLAVLFGTLYLHQIAATLVRASVQQQGRAGLRHVWPAVAVFSVIIVTVAASVARAWPDIQASGAVNVLGALRAVLDSAPASIAVAPFAAVLAPVTADSLTLWMTPFAIAIAVLAGHYIWVIRMDAAFEEGAVEAGAARAARVAAMRQGKRVSLSASPKQVRAPWFALPAAGEPVYAIWWKNVLQVTRGTSPVLLVLILAVPAFLMFLDTRGGPSNDAAVIGAMLLLSFGAMATFMGPLHLRNDLRGDLRRIELLRTLPVGGARLVAAEVAASALTLFFVQAVMFSIAAVLLLFAGRLTLPVLAWLGVIPALLLLLIVNCTMILIHNGFALYFPAWANLKGGQGPGVENFGQNILVMLGTFLLFVLSLVGPLIVAAVSGATFVVQMGAYAAVPAVLMFVVALYVQAAGITVWLGRVYDRIDPVEAGLCD